MDKIRVGVSATLSGRYGLQGKESFNGLNLWVENTNKSGGILLKKLSKKLPIELIHYDDKSNPENTRQITRKLIKKDKVDILLGPYSSTLTIAAAKISEYHNRVLWNYGGSSDEIANSGFKKVVSSITPASRYFEPFLNFINEQDKKVKSVVIVFAKDSGFSTEVAKGATSYCRELGIDYKKYSYNSGNKDFSNIINQIRSEKLKYVLGVGRFEDDVNLAKYLKRLYSCLVAAGIEEFKNQLQEESNGFFSVTQWEPEVEYDTGPAVTSKHFTDLYQKKFNKTPDYVSAQSFNMGIILKRFIEETASINEEYLMNKAIHSKFCTFYGNFEIELKSGIQVGHKTLVTQWQNGKREIIYPFSRKTSQVIDLV